MGGGRTSAWDSQNRLVSCILGGSTSTFKYGADGLRRQKTAGGATTDYAYDGTMMVREGHAAGGSLTPATVTATYLIGPQGPEYRRDDTQLQTDGQGHTFSGKASWYVFDGLGSVVGEVDPLGNLTSSPKYDVYGAVRANAGTASSKQGFVGGLGHVSDTETGLIYMQARYYDPSVGRFVSEDSEYDGMNWFSYAGNNPINRVDRSGKSAEAAGQEMFLAAWTLYMAMIATTAEVPAAAIFRGMMAAGISLILSAISGQATDEGVMRALVVYIGAWATEAYKPPSGGAGGAAAVAVIGIMAYVTILDVYSSTIGIDA